MTEVYLLSIFNSMPSSKGSGVGSIDSPMVLIITISPQAKGLSMVFRKLNMKNKIINPSILDKCWL